MRQVNVRYGGFFRKSGVVNGAGYIYDKEGDFERWCENRTISAYVFVYLLEGSGFYKDDLTGEHLVETGDVILLFPGLTHSYGRLDPEAAWSECFIELQGDTIEALEKDGVISRNTPILRLGLQPALVAGCDEIIRDYQTAKPGEEALFAARALLMLVRLAEAHRQKDQSDVEKSFMVDACARLQATLDVDIQLSEVARTFGMSERTFRRRFVAQMGVAPARYRLLQRIAAARTLLHGSGLSLRAIAEKLGYCDVHFFSKQFKEVTGITPTQFREEPVPAGT